MASLVGFKCIDSNKHTQYIDQLELLCNQLGTDMETKIPHFIHGLKSCLKEALVLWQPGDYNTAVSIAKLKESTTQTNYDEILNKVGKEI